METMPDEAVKLLPDYSLDTNNLVQHTTDIDAIRIHGSPSAELSQVRRGRGRPPSKNKVNVKKTNFVGEKRGRGRPKLTDQQKKKALKFNENGFSKNDDDKDSKMSDDAGIEMIKSPNKKRKRGRPPIKKPQNPGVKTTYGSSASETELHAHSKMKRAKLEIPPPKTPSGRGRGRPKSIQQNMSSIGYDSNDEVDNYNSDFETRPGDVKSTQNIIKNYINGNINKSNISSSKSSNDNTSSGGGSSSSSCSYSSSSSNSSANDNASSSSGCSSSSNSTDIGDDNNKNGHVDNNKIDFDIN